MTPLRTRLMNPPNAVPDTGITMRNGCPVRLMPSPPKPVPEPEPAPPQLPSLDELPLYFSRRYPALRALAAGFGTSVKALRGRRGTSPLPERRQAAVAIMRHLLQESAPAIGRTFNRDHTTIIHAIRKMKPHVEAIAAVLGDTTDPFVWAQAMRTRLDAHRSHVRPPCPANRDHGGQAGF